MNKPTFDVRFFKTNSGTEPVREWLRVLPAIDRKTIGEDIKTVQFGMAAGYAFGAEDGQGSVGSAHPLGESNCKSAVYGINGQNYFASRIYQEISSNPQGRS